MQAVPRFFFSVGILRSGKCFAPRLPTASAPHSAYRRRFSGKRHRATDVEAGDGVMRQGIGAVAVVVVPVHIVKEASHVLGTGNHPGGRADSRRRWRWGFVCGSMNRMRRRLTSLHAGGSARKRERFVLSALSRMQRAILVRLLRVGRSAPHIVWKWAKLALVVKQVPKNRGMLGDHGSGATIAIPSHTPCPCQRISSLVQGSMPSPA